MQPCKSPVKMLVSICTKCLVCCFVSRGSAGGFSLLGYFSGVVSHPRGLQVLQYGVSVESSYLIHHT